MQQIWLLCIWSTISFFSYTDLNVSPTVADEYDIYRDMISDDQSLVPTDEQNDEEED